MMKKFTQKLIAAITSGTLLASALPLTVFASDSEPVEKIYSTQDFQEIYKDHEVISGPDAVDINSITALKEADITINDVTLEEFIQQNTFDFSQENGWVNEKDGWYYLENNIPVAYNEWVEIGGAEYFFNDEGKLHQGWLEYDGVTYYCDSDGEKHTGWLEDGENYYFFDPNGHMATGWVEENDELYYLYPDTGIMAKETQEIDGLYYYLGENGVLRDSNEYLTEHLDVTSVSHTFTSVTIKYKVTKEISNVFDCYLGYKYKSNIDDSYKMIDRKAGTYTMTLPVERIGTIIVKAYIPMYGMPADNMEYDSYFNYEKRGETTNYTEVKFWEVVGEEIAEYTFMYVVGKLNVCITAYYNLGKIVTVIENANKIYNALTTPLKMRDVFIEGSDKIPGTYIKTVQWFDDDGFHIEQEFWYPNNGKSGKERFNAGESPDVAPGDKTFDW